MKNKILFLFLSLVLMFGVIGPMGIQTAQAQTAPTFPVGCTSNLGYSVTNGTPCNGTSRATMNIAGCTTALGYSITSGVPCDGASVAIQYLAGCTSVYGYSNISGVPCNGTTVASVALTSGVDNTGAIGLTTSPALPVTGVGGNAFTNIMLLLSSVSVALLGSVYLLRKHRTS